ncbi:MAG TPA: hemin uptake protein HemP [Ideonella sp.]|uniref:hemin uptake protein HemP n=1 Tax=Ideonella sp. TaxID=1929293 RepID=UPI002E326376|nr:hemin uptake protein HemP [Ideonella sp.]HEX5682715.1 hemin uptake protein HemP [Ideonella sp.]
MQSKPLASASLSPSSSLSLSTPLADAPAAQVDIERAPDVDFGPPSRVAESGGPMPTWRSEELLAGADEAQITHGDQVYRLRRTTTGKLILTK